MCQTGPYMVLNWKKERKRDHVLPDKLLDLKIWKYVSIDVFHCHLPSSNIWPNQTSNAVIGRGNPCMYPSIRLS